MDTLSTTYEICDTGRDLARSLFLREHGARGHRHLAQRELKLPLSGAALPARAAQVRSFDLGPHRTFYVFDLDDAVVLVENWKTSATVTASAPEAALALSLVEEVRSGVTRVTAEGTVDVSFVDSKSGARYLELDTRPWATIRQQYPQPVVDALDALVAHQPEAVTSRRLLLWHGAPGTGKTTAIGALLDAWREWADGVIVTDPETLLSDGPYLRRTVLEADDDDRWQVLVLEDAETLLHKGTGGRGMATLLNLCDGLLGQGLRCLFLITTNEPLDRVHPALVRPGRCLSRIEFGRLQPAEAARLLGRPVAAPMTLAEALATAPVSAEAAPAEVGMYL